MSNVTLKINGDLVNQIDQKLMVALEEIGLVAEGYAKMVCPVDKGRLRNSITHTVNGNKAVIGTNTEYAAFVEFGTGRYSTNGGGTTKESWVYKDSLGNWHRGYPQVPRPFIKPAIADHIAEYSQIAAEMFTK